MYGNSCAFELFTGGEVEKRYFIANITDAVARRNAALGFLLKKNAILNVTQVTTISIFHFRGWKNKFRALSQMGLAPARMQHAPGLSFFKLLGSGAENGFSIRPNFGTYALLGVWDAEADADRFFQKHPAFQHYRSLAASWQTIYMRNTAAHGAWDGQNPFQTADAFDPTEPVAVITRATIRRRHLWRFWRFVPSVSRDVENRPGLRLAIGIGELPLLQQATFSLWDSGRQMLDYAYRRPEHSAMVRKTRELGWYKEELFARFKPYRMENFGLQHAD
jgi:hypothetical protein